MKNRQPAIFTFSAILIIIALVWAVILVLGSMKSSIEKSLDLGNDKSAVTRFEFEKLGEMGIISR